MLGHDNETKQRIMKKHSHVVKFNLADGYLSANWTLLFACQHKFNVSSDYGCRSYFKASILCAFLTTDLIWRWVSFIYVELLNYISG